MRYLTRNSPGITLATFGDSPTEQYFSADGRHGGEAWKLDVGAECNRLLDFADELDHPLNADRHSVRDDIRSLVERVATFEGLGLTP